VEDGERHQTAGLIPFPKGKSGNPGGQPKGKAFRKKLRDFIEHPENWRLLEEKFLRDLKGDGAGTFALKCLAYVYGEPKQTVELDVRTEAERVALQLGIPVDELLAQSAQLAGDMN
jgi:hypothetical protein